MSYAQHRILFLSAPPRRPIFKCLKNLFSASKGNNTSTKSWIEKFAPRRSQPYLHLVRADKQIGTLLLFWPCCWGTLLATPIGQTPSTLILLKFGLGALIMRSAGCIINDLFDRDIDKHVERTKNRPLASGELSVNQALVFLSVNLLSGLAVLVTFNYNSILLGFGVMPIVVIYPLMKRITNWPQLVLGLAFNWGALVGWTAVQGTTSLPHILPLYVSGVCWTLTYDTIYAYQDREDDVRVGVKSTARALGDRPQVPLTVISMGMVSGLCASGYMAELSLPFYCGVGLVEAQLLWQIWTMEAGNRSNLWSRFSSNGLVGGLVAGALYAGTAF